MKFIKRKRIKDDWEEINKEKENKDDDIDDEDDLDEMELEAKYYKLGD